MSKPECPACQDKSGVIPLPNGEWFCGDCNYSFEVEEVVKK